ncbi:hypothetical protein DPMN_092134 [Dreissena polymorpha]|uniref:Uncharacterized protein n=1 Tax=Dreissena polymorpha TaxID=45954 RepID=A0A9D4L3C6_DREPO|nr:hypothetical protein DPMN_092134 [Dreissena polymorpha]
MTTKRCTFDRTLVKFNSCLVVSADCATQMTYKASSIYGSFAEYPITDRCLADIAMWIRIILAYSDFNSSEGEWLARRMT